MRNAILAVVVAAFAWSCGSSDPEPTRVRLATTTSTENTGLLEYLLPPFEEENHIEVQVIAVGTGQAIAIAERGDADIVLVHARSREDAFVAGGHGVDRRDVMWNDFVILGPPADPAQIRGMNDAAAAFRRIRDAHAAFVSRGDDSGTHIREKEIWTAAGGAPSANDDWYLSAGQGMGKCLVVADEKSAYVLADRGTFLAFKGKVDLEVLVERDRRLRNEYGAILVSPTLHPNVEAKGARALLDYLTSKEGRERIASFCVEGEPLFHVTTDAE